MKHPGLFRKKALDNISSSEKLDKMLTITSPRSWLALVGIGLIIMALISWSFWGNITSRVAGEGIILSPGGISRVVASTDGRVDQIKVEPGVVIESGQKVAVLVDHRGNEEQVYSYSDGRTLETFVRKGDQVNVGSPLFSLEVAEDGNLDMIEALLFIPVGEGQRIIAGMEAYIAPVVISKEEHGYMMGRVSSVSEYPASHEGALKVLGNEELARQLAGRTLSVKVRIELYRDQATPSGYQWTTGRGPESPVKSGTLCAGFVITESERPINFVFPGLR